MPSALSTISEAQDEGRVALGVRRAHADLRWHRHRALRLVTFAHSGYFRLGSWLCENVVARRADRIDLPSDRYSRREDSPGLSISINQRKIILLVFEFSGFSHRWSQNPKTRRRLVCLLPPQPDSCTAEKRGHAAEASCFPPSGQLGCIGRLGDRPFLGGFNNPRQADRKG